MRLFTRSMQNGYLRITDPVSLSPPTRAARVCPGPNTTVKHGVRIPWSLISNTMGHLIEEKPGIVGWLRCLEGGDCVDGEDLGRHRQHSTCTVLCLGQMTQKVQG